MRASKKPIVYILVLQIAFLSCSSSGNKISSASEGVVRADSLLRIIQALYAVDKYGLLQETYPINPNHQVTYLADNGAQQKAQEVSYLWPYSGMLSGVVSLYKTTGQSQYKTMLRDQILPGLELYWDSTRLPYCYQSYPLFNGESDRFYDDNDWIAIDFCDYYALTKEEKYLKRAENLHRYIYSGWSDDLGGGIYWCEQKKTSKNTCSNAPATVLSMKLYNLTQNEVYFDWAKKTYQWTKENLLDTADQVYWDNISTTTGKIDKAKYTYNSGQMIQAGVLLFKATGDSTYLKDAQQTAAGVHKHFLQPQKVKFGEKMFYPSSPWFNVILFRGLKALYEEDGNKTYVKSMMENAAYAWMNTRDENGLLHADWSGNRKDQYKWLLDNASMIELYAEMSAIDFADGVY